MQSSSPSDHCGAEKDKLWREHEKSMAAIGGEIRRLEERRGRGAVRLESERDSVEA